MTKKITTGFVLILSCLFDLAGQGIIAPVNQALQLPGAPPSTSFLAPVLISDSVHVRNYSGTNPNTLTNESSSKFFYNAAGQLIRERAYEQFGGWRDFDYTRTPDGRLLESLTTTIDANGGATPNSKTVYTYDASDRETGNTNYSWNNVSNSWDVISRQGIEYPAPFKSVTTSQVNQNGDWVNTNRNTSIRNTNNTDLEILRLSESWESDAWKKVFGISRTYNANNDLLTEVFSFGFGTDPFIPKDSIIYTYDAQGKLDESIRFSFSTILFNEWAAVSREVYNYSANGVLETVYAYDPESNSNQSRRLFSYNSGEFSDLLSENVLETWSQTAMVFQESNRTQTPYNELPDGRILLNLKVQAKPTPGQGDWLSSFEVDVFFLRGASDTQSPDDLSCAVPNPYPLHTPVRCEALNADEQYLLQVYDLSGRAVYTRYFKGESGWDIDREIGQGLFVATIQSKGKRVGVYKLIIGE